MKYLITILLFVSFSAIGQDVKVEVTKKKSVSEQITDATTAYAAATAARAEAAKARAATAAAMNDASTNIIVPLEVDLNNYTHIALVGVTYVYTSTGNKVSGKSQYEDFTTYFLNSPLSVINPYEYNKKVAKKNNRLLREIKNPNWLYLYLDTSLVGVDIHSILVLRDSMNKIIFQGKYVNVSASDFTSPLVYF